MRINLGLGRISARVADLYTSTQAYPPIEEAPGLCRCAQVSHDSSWGIPELYRELS